MKRQRKSELSWLDAIVTVLRSAGRAMHYTEIADEVIGKHLRTNLGATPAMTVGSVIATDIKQRGNGSLFVRVDRGQYILRELSDPGAGPGLRARSGRPQSPTQPSPAALIASDEQPSVVQALGMYWRRELVVWSVNPKILGAQQRDASPVDFSAQLGVYLLHDGRVPVYVGRATDQHLGRRLAQHTSDRLNGRWDRFSWFGVLPVRPDGTLGEPVSQSSSDQVITDLEAVLIEALEPPQNRRRGDGLQGIEYIQVESPGLKEKKILGLVQDFQSRLLKES